MWTKNRKFEFMTYEMCAIYIYSWVTVSAGQYNDGNSIIFLCLYIMERHRNGFSYSHLLRVFMLKLILCL